MSDGAKVMFSEFEAKLAADSEWILTKHAIIQKLSDLFAAQVPVINEIFTGSLTGPVPDFPQTHPKISKGEKYRLLPYVILDYPASFSKTAIFALRTMFWWGNFVSVTLHISGSFKEQLQAIIARNMGKTGPAFFISTGAEEWEHHFEATNYIEVESLSAAALYKKIVQPSFIKIALKYDLGEWNNMDQLLKKAYTELSGLLQP